MSLNLSQEFDIDTFKVHKCQLDKHCPNDYHLCPYYHESAKGDEERRPLSLFRYMDKTGGFCFNEKKKKYCPNDCIYGIFCEYLHSKNEYNYHPNHFGKQYECERKKVNGKCIYYRTCYGIHHDEEENEEEEKEEEIGENIIQEEIEQDEDIKISKEKSENVFNLAKYFRCRKCQNVINSGNICYFVKCKHFLCGNCFKQLKKLNKSQKEEEQKSNSLSCPFCHEDIQKSVLNINFT